jgi:hypothetical protein
MAKKKKVTTDELRAIVSRQITQAQSSTAISKERAELFDAYMAEPYAEDVNIAEGDSRVVSTDISDTIEWIMPELMEIFTAGDKVVSFEPLGPDDEERAEQETDVVNHVFMRQNEGFLVLYSFIKDGLIQKNGYCKRWWDKSEKTSKECYEGLTPDELMKIAGQWEQSGAEVEITAQRMDEQGIYIEARVTEREERIKIVPVPPEELLIHPRWNSISLVGCPFVAHKKRETVSSLIEMGFERKQVEAIGESSDEEFSEELISRFNQRGSEEDSDGEPADASMTEIMVYECYVYLDHDGDGIAELRKVTAAGSGHEILRMEDGEDANEEVLNSPFSSWTPIIVPHRHNGRSIAELVKDIQRIQTSLRRNTLDNFYRNNNPTREIAEDGIGENTIEDMLVQRPGQIIRPAQPGMYVEHTPPQFAAQSLAVIEYIDTVRENRTGVSRLSQGLDANTINKTARGQAQLMSAAQKKIALIARIAAETGVKDLFRGIHEDLRRNASKALTVRLRGTWVDVDPREWRSRADVAANVALGIGNAEQQLTKLMLIADKQEQNLLHGSPLVTPKNLHHTYEKMVDVAGFKNASVFFTDPDTVEPKEPPPDPEMVKVQGQLEMQKMKLEGDAALREQDAQFDRQNKQDELQLQAQKMQMEMAMAREKMEGEMALAREKMSMEMQLEHWKAEQEIAIKREVATIDAAVAHRNNEMKDETARANGKDKGK